MRYYKYLITLLFSLTVVFSIYSCSTGSTIKEITRNEAIPTEAVKITPSMDTLPPILYSDKYEKPVPLGSAINTAGAEDSAFIMPDGETLYFFFTPDVRVPPEKQIIDGATGIYVSHKQGDNWTEAERVMLQDTGELALDGCEFVRGNEMWFCSARKGNLRELDMWTAEFKDGKWQNWKDAGSKLNVDYGIGEMHISADGNEMYFHADKPGGMGSYDIWVTRKVNCDWQTPENVIQLNTADREGWPFLTEDGNEIWFTRVYKGTPAIFKAVRSNGGEWSSSELVISQFAGEPSLDRDGNIYFTHHYYKDGTKLEADIYIAYRKK
jgi:hypothetical protein